MHDPNSSPRLIETGLARIEPIIARRSIRHYSWGVVWGLSFALVSHLLGLPGGYSLLVGVLLAAGPPAFGLARAALGQDEVLRIDEAGIVDHRLTASLIPWDQVMSAERAGGRLHVRIKDPSALGLSNTLWTRMNQPLGAKAGTYLIGLGGLDVGADEICRVVRDRLDT